MKLFRFFSRVALLTGLVWGINGCNSFDLDINKDPNNPLEASPALLLGNAQLNMAYGLDVLDRSAAGFMNQQSYYDSWVMQNTAFNTNWSYIYATTLKDIQAIINNSTKTDTRAENPHYLGVGKLLKAHVFATLVDFYGDIPFSEALQGDASNPIAHPKFDKDKDVYDACLVLIDEAIEVLQKESPVDVGANDLIYGGDAAKWITYANSLKIKLLMNKRLADPSANAQIAAIYEAGDIIDESSENFEFRFSNTVVPDYRHPWYTTVYSANDNGFTYISTEIMVKMLINKDPRWPFYFRRQTSNILDQVDPTQRNTTPCSSTVGCVYSYVVLNEALINEIYPDGDEDLSFLAGIFGRDRADPGGVPADNSLRTIPGVYPCGGSYDVAVASLPGTNTAPGRGVYPMLTSWHMKFIQAEAILAGVITGDARQMLSDAITDQITLVSAFGTDRDDNAVAISNDAVTAYVDAALVTYDAATTDANRTKIVMQQLWYSSFGSCIEMYNMFRRNINTDVEGSWPGFLQDPLETFGRKFPLRLPYPQNEVSLNPNAASFVSVQYDNDPIFWDTNK